nr:hypothetical protein [Mesorhizobium loti]
MSIELASKIVGRHGFAKSEIDDCTAPNPLPQLMRPKEIGNLHGRGTELYLSILDVLGHLDRVRPTQVQALLEETEHVLGEFLRRKN